MADGGNGNGNGADWFHLNAIGNFIKNVGFPVAMCVALTFIVYMGARSLDHMESQMARFHDDHIDISRASWALASSIRDQTDFVRGKEGLPPLPPLPTNGPMTDARQTQ